MKIYYEVRQNVMQIPYVVGKRVGGSRPLIFCNAARNLVFSIDNTIIPLYKETAMIHAAWSILI